MDKDLVPQVNYAVSVIQELINEFPDFDNVDEVRYEDIPFTYLKHLNDPAIKDSIRLLQHFTTSPSWLDLAQIFLPKPGPGQDEHRLRLAALGLDTEFIDLLFYQPYRPRTDMLNLPRSVLIQPHHSDTINPTFEPLTVSGMRTSMINMDEGYYRDVIIPVLRYQQDEGSYYYIGKHSNVRFCGTYYYYQYNSGVLLRAPNCMVTLNKLTAAMEMGYTPQMLSDFFVGSFSDTAFAIQTGGVFGTDIKKFLEQLLTPGHGGLFPLDQPAPLSFYAFEDFVDQIICQRAREMKIDLIVLKAMVGKSGYVTEILDTRERLVSFNNLLFPPIVGPNPGIEGSPTIIYNFDDLLRAFTSGNDALIYMTRDVRRIRYGIMDPELDPFENKYQPLDSRFRLVEELTGAISLSGNITQQLSYLGDRTLFGDVALSIEEEINEDEEFALGGLGLGNDKISNIKILLADELGRKVVYEAEPRGAYYCPYEWAPVPEFEIESLHIDGDGTVPVPKNIGISPVQLILRHEDAYEYLAEALETYPSIFEVSTWVDQGRLVFPTTPNYNIRKFIPITIEQLPETLRVFPNVFQLEVYATPDQLTAFQALTRVNLIAKSRP